MLTSYSSENILQSQFQNNHVVIEVGAPPVPNYDEEMPGVVQSSFITSIADSFNKFLNFIGFGPSNTTDQEQ
jgi:hypothetical protein